MVERVARALAISRGGVHYRDDLVWSKAAQSYRELAAEWPAYANNGGDLICDAFRDARAAIEAMREPSDEMTSAADASDREYTDFNFGAGSPLVQQSGYDHYRAMIDAALAEGEKG